MEYRIAIRAVLRMALCVFVILCAIPAGVSAAPRKITIKLAASVPENTPWGKHLNQMAGEWARATNGEVELKIFYSGSAGNEADVMRKLKTNAIQAAILTSFGLNELTPEVLTISCPFLIRNEDELDAVMKIFKPELERKIDSTGKFHLVAWSKVGWVRFFSKAPVFVPADLKKQKLGTDENDTQLLDAFRAMGYNMVPVPQSQILVSLTGGQIDAVYLSPVMAGGTQAFGLAKNMASINVAPFLGAVVINDITWRRIPEKYRAELLRIAKSHEDTMDREIRSMENEVIEMMKQYGLVINTVTPAQAQVWYADVQKVLPQLYGKTINKQTYNRIASILQSFRSSF